MKIKTQTKRKSRLIVAISLYNSFQCCRFLALYAASDAPRWPRRYRCGGNSDRAPIRTTRLRFCDFSNITASLGAFIITQSWRIAYSALFSLQLVTLFCWRFDFSCLIRCNSESLGTLAFIEAWVEKMEWWKFAGVMKKIIVTIVLITDSEDLTYIHLVTTIR